MCTELGEQGVGSRKQGVLKETFRVAVDGEGQDIPRRGNPAYLGIMGRHSEGHMELSGEESRLPMVLGAISLKANTVGFRNISSPLNPTDKFPGLNVGEGNLQILPVINKRLDDHY